MPDRQGPDPDDPPGPNLTVTPPETPRVLFAHANIVDVERGQILADRDVLVEDGLIAAVGTGLDAPANALAVDARGRYLMPGLIDTHVHLTSGRELLLFVASGVTTVQSLGGTLEENLARAAAVETGAVAGPTIVSCDYVVRGLSSAADAQAVVDAAIGSGVECLKIYSPPDWTSEAHQSLIRVARERGLRIGGHLPRNLPLADGLGHQQQFVAHAEEFLYAHFFKFPDRFDERRLEPAAALTRHGGAIVSPTLVAYRRIVEQVGPGIERLLERPELAYVPEETLEQWKPPRNRYRQRFTPEDGQRLGAAFAFQQKLVRALSASGVTLAVGTDAAGAMPFVVAGFSALDELDELALAGLTPAEVLRAAIIGGAALVGRSDRLGAVVPGRQADLLLLDGNPIDAIGHVRRRRWVMVRGRWMPEEWLQAHLRQR
jgi:imidazolonepropionase-like amidohydrolase